MDTIWFGKLTDTPVGTVWVGVSARGLGVVFMGAAQEGFEAEVRRRYGKVRLQESHSHTADALQQIREYLDGKRREFTLPIDWEGMGDFQRQALQATFAIPYGETRTYGELAAHLGNPRAARAVGRAEATNPMPLVVPCHRVLGADGKLHGYGGGNGLPTKAWLLQLEQGAVVESGA
ncbi:MAG: methylated-DNA--[protein]-cysteine S-methyltransferase [Anaerolineae bacterium]|nr:MAG: methylated-DNA--[protein]-cysteine S-methyltransferase [Anaerolineae bacterium]